MADQLFCDVARRHDFVLLFDVADGNPNGDPDAGNLPRVDPETMQGLVTDVALKRKIRNWVDLVRGSEERYKIYVQRGIALNAQHARAYTALNLTSTGIKQKQEDIDQVRTWMCANFYDVRLFGAVMSTSVNCGQVLGPVQLTFARSIDPVVPLDVSITRIAVTREEDMQITAEGEGGKSTEMGRKAIVPYGLYRCSGFFSPHHAERTGVTPDDLELVWQALEHMWEADRSAARGFMACRGLYVFTHESKLGNAPAHRLFERITARRKSGGSEAVRSFSDYVIEAREDDLPAGVTMTTLVG